MVKDQDYLYIMASIPALFGRRLKPIPVQSPPFQQRKRHIRTNQPDAVHNHAPLTLLNHGAAACECRARDIALVNTMYGIGSMELRGRA